MAELMRIADWRRGYVDICEVVAATGDERDCRAGTVRELRDFVFTLDPSCIDLPVGVGRNVPVALAAAEAIQLCAGLGMPYLTEAVSSTVASFVRDPDGTVHGNYGQRVGSQLVDVAHKMIADKYTRQAVIQIWNKRYDKFNVPMPKDIPCTLTITFGVDADGLTMSVSMRSNDVWLGLPFDVFQFRQLQRTMAYVLKMDIGGYCHHAVSMHAYDRNIERIDELVVSPCWSDESIGDANGIRVDSARYLVSTALDILRGGRQNDLSNIWYQDKLAGAYATLG